MSEVADYQLTDAEKQLRADADWFDARNSDPNNILNQENQQWSEEQTTAVVVSKSLGTIALSVVLSEEHSSELEIARSPIEGGADIVDHAYVRPKTLRLEAAIGVATQVSAVDFSNFFYASGSSTGATDPQSLKFVQESWAALVKLQEDRKPFSIVSGLQVYNNMLIRRLSCRRDATNSLVLQFTADLQEIKIVDTQEIEGAQGSTQANMRGTTSAAKARGSAVQDKAAAETKGAGGVQSVAAQADGAKQTSTLYRLLGGS